MAVDTLSAEIPASTPTRSSRIARAMLLVVVCAIAIPAFVKKVEPRMVDLTVYWRAGARAAASQPLYQGADEHYQFKYFPAFAVLAIPLGLLPLTVAKAIWFFA